MEKTSCCKGYYIFFALTEVKSGTAPDKPAFGSEKGEEPGCPRGGSSNEKSLDAAIVMVRSKERLVGWVVGVRGSVELSYIKTLVLFTENHKCSANLAQFPQLLLFFLNVLVSCFTIV